MGERLNGRVERQGPGFFSRQFQAALVMPCLPLHVAFSLRLLYPADAPHSKHIAQATAPAGCRWPLLYRSTARTWPSGLLMVLLMAMGQTRAGPVCDK